MGQACSALWEKETTAASGYMLPKKFSEKVLSLQILLWSMGLILAGIESCLRDSLPSGNDLDVSQNLWAKQTWSQGIYGP